MSNGECTASDIVVITNNTIDADAGPDQALALLDTDTYFEAVLGRIVPDNGQYCTVTEIFKQMIVQHIYVYNLPTGENIFLWNVLNGTTGCMGSGYVSIFVANFIADAGADQIVCTDTAVLNATSEPGSISETWSIVSGSAVFDEIHNPNTVVRNLSGGANILRWTITSVGFFGYDDVLIYNDYIFISAGTDVTTCHRTHQMNAQQILNADSTYWSPIGIGGGTIQNNTACNTLVTNLQPGTSFFEWYVNNGNCESRDTVEITYNLPPIAQFETDPTVFCAPEWVTINNTSTQYGGQSPPDEFQWLIEDVFIPTTYDVNTDVTHYFTNTANWDSIYNIRLIAIDYETMCRDTFYSNVTASARPIVGFEIAPDAPQRIPEAVFTFQNTSATNLASYHWDFGNTDTRYDVIYVPQFDYEYTVAGTYIIIQTQLTGSLQIVIRRMSGAVILK